MLSKTNIVRLFILTTSAFAATRALPQSEEDQVERYLGNYYNEEIDASDFSSEEQLERGFSCDERSRFTVDKNQTFDAAQHTYAGSPYKSYHRSTVHFRNYAVNITTEKDAGESSMTDFLSASVQVENEGSLKRLVVGDYVLEYGQGLVLWRGVGAAKGSDVIGSPVKHAGGPRSYRSSDEAQFFRGAAARFATGNFFFDAFWSKKSLDASLDSAGKIRSLDLDGYHRTVSEITKKNLVNEVLTGGALGVEYESARASIYGYTSSFSHKFIASENIFSSVGSSLDVGSDRLRFSCEVASADRHSPSGIASVGIKENATEVLVAFRHVPPDALSLHSYGFGESAYHQSNEEGLYLGIEQKIATDATLRFYIDHFTTLGPSAQTPQALRGVDMLAQYEYQLSSSLQCVFRLRYERGDEETKSGAGGILSSGIHERTRFGSRAEFRLRNKIEVRGRVEAVQVERAFLFPSRGLLSFIETSIPFAEKTFLDLRITAFSTTNYDSRLYAFETVAPGMMENVLLYGTGTRFSLRARVTVSEWCELNMKLEQTLKGGNAHYGEAVEASRIVAQVDVGL